MDSTSSAPVCRGFHDLAHAPFLSWPILRTAAYTFPVSKKKKNKPTFMILQKQNIVLFQGPGLPDAL